MAIMPGSGFGVEVEHEQQRQRAQANDERLPSRFAPEHTNTWLRTVWPFAAVLVMVIGVAVDQIVIALVAGTVLTAGVIAWAWARWSLERLEFGYTLSQTHAFVGETVELALRFENRKLLPLPSLRVRLLVPELLEPSNTPFTRVASVGGADVGEIIRSTSMRWYERLTWRYQIPLRTRGYYHLVDSELTASDVFGVYRRQREEIAEQRLWVYPEVLPLERLELPQLRPHGERRGGQRLFDDPTRLQTIRDYRPGDPLKRIDWKATARRREVQSRVYDPASDLVAVVALNVSTLPIAWQGFYGDVFERAVSVAASLASAWAESRAPVGLLANCTFPGNDAPIRVTPSRSPGQMTRILEALAMADVFTLTPIDRMLTDERRRMPFGSTVALVTAVVTRPLEVSIDRLRRRGVEVSVVYVGIDDPPAQAGGATVHDIREALAGLEYERIGHSGAWTLAEHEWGRPQEDEELDGVGPRPEVEAPSFGAAPTEPTPQASVPAAVGLERGGGSEWGRPDDGDAR